MQYYVTLQKLREKEENSLICHLISEVNLLICHLLLEENLLIYHLLSQENLLICQLLLEENLQICHLPLIDDPLQYFHWLQQILEPKYPQMCYRF